MTKRRLYCMRLWARPRGFFFLSCLATFGVWPLTFPARANDPCTLPANNYSHWRSSDHRSKLRTSDFMIILSKIEITHDWILIATSSSSQERGCRFLELGIWRKTFLFRLVQIQRLTSAKRNSTKIRCRFRRLHRATSFSPSFFYN